MNIVLANGKFCVGRIICLVTGKVLQEKNVAFLKSFTPSDYCIEGCVFGAWGQDLQAGSKLLLMGAQRKCHTLGTQEGGHRGDERMRSAFVGN